MVSNCNTLYTSMVLGYHMFKLWEKQESSSKVRKILSANFLNTIGKSTIFIGRIKYRYKGEVDKDGKACGYGKAEKYKGFWFSNKPHGLVMFCKWRFAFIIIIRKQGRRRKVERKWWQWYGWNANYRNITLVGIQIWWDLWQVHNMH